MTTGITQRKSLQLFEALRQGYPADESCSRSSRTATRAHHDLIDDFSKALSIADALLVTEVYAAGETPIPGADGRAICRAVRGRGLVEPVFVEK